MKNIITLLLLAFILPYCNEPSQKDKIQTDSDKTQLPTESEKVIANKERDEALIGLWKNTEILGTGEFTMTNETLMEFLEDGSVATWPGRSVGPDYSREEDRSKTSKGTWYTKGESLHLVDPVTGQDAETYYTVNESGLLMSDGSQKKLFVRVR